MKKTVSTAERRHQDYLRRNAMKVALVYDRKLKRFRSQALKDCLSQCAELDPAEWKGYIQNNLNEPYLADWMKGLYIGTGLPQAKATARYLSTRKAGFGDILLNTWENALLQYAQKEAGKRIVTVSGTFKDTICRILDDEMEEFEGGVEALTQIVFKRFHKYELDWMVRRIAQTETMMALGKAGDVAAKSLEIPFTKTWVTSGMGNVRDTHAAMDGITVDEDDMFNVDGSYLYYPHDTSLNAEAKEIINCACDCLRYPKK